MNKKQTILIISIVVFIAVLIGISVLLNNINKNDSDNEAIKGEILRIDSRNWDEKVITEEKFVLVDFYAEWCGPCQMLSPLVEELAGDKKYNNNFKFYKLNVDFDSQIAMDYGIQYLPTLVIFKDGQEITRAVGYLEKQKLIDFVNSVK